MLHVLIVDAEEDLLWALSKNLFKNRSDIRIHTASSNDRAIEVLKEEEIGLLVVDTSLGGGIDSFNLIRLAKDLASEARLLIMTAFDDKGVDLQPSLGVAEFINKPFEIDALRDAIATVRESDPGAAQSTLNDLALADILSLLCLSERTVLLHLNHRGRRGRIEVIEGKIRHAEFEELVGPEALFTLLGLLQGDIFMQSDFSPSKESINEPWQSLLSRAKNWLETHQLEEFEAEVEIPVEGWDDDFDLLDDDEEEPDNPLGFSPEELREMVMEDDGGLLNLDPPLAPSSTRAQEDSPLPRPPLLMRPPSGVEERVRIPTPPVMPRETTKTRRPRPPKVGIEALFKRLPDELPAFVAGALIDTEDGSTLMQATRDEGFNIESFAAYYGEVLRMGELASTAFGPAKITTLQISTKRAFILARRLEGTPYVQLVLMSRPGNLGIAQVVMRRLERDILAQLPS